MNNDLQKKLIATHDQIDPSLVTAEDLVRAVRGPSIDVFNLAERLGYFYKKHGPSSKLGAIELLSGFVTLPEDKPKPTTYARTTGYDHDPIVQRVTKYDVVADYQVNENE